MTREPKQAQALLRVFESLGVPLISAVAELAAWQNQSASDYADEDAAKNFSALLSASISSGTQLSAKLAPATQDDAEAARLKSATLAGALIAQHYVLSGQFPDDAFNRRMAIAFDGVLGLADSFALPPEDEGNTTDILSARIEALTPLVQAVMRFPFGIDDNTVIRRLGERLCDKATALADAFTTTPELHTAREIAFLKGCSKLLARSCEIEMDQMQQALAQNRITEAPAPDILMEHIWNRFEKGLDVLRAVIGFISGPATAQGAPAPRAEAPKAAPAIPPAAEKPKGTPGNPMSFFAKKDGESTSGEAA